MNAALWVWENEGGAPVWPPGMEGFDWPLLRGTANQIEWANSIRILVDAEFDRVAAAFRSIAERQRGVKAAGTKSIIAILEDKRDEVMSQVRAGYFIHEWQEIGDQVRRMIAQDPRYQAIQQDRAA